MRIPAPDDITKDIADRAVAIARVWSAARGWRIASSLSSWSESGEAGIVTNKQHVLYQNSGTKPFLMHALEGKVVPIGRRLVTVKGVGQPGWVNVPVMETNSQGVSYPGLRRNKKWRNQKWRHPGIRPKHFLENSLQQAIWEYKGEMEKLTQETLMGNPEYIAQMKG